MKNCKECSYFGNNYCTKFKTIIQLLTNADDCKFHTIEKIKSENNIGLNIRNNKLKKKFKKANTIKSEQKYICRFVTVEWVVIEKVNGKFKATGKDKSNGLQIKNRVYLLDGKYKLVNNESFKIKKEYEGIPEWATPDLIEKHNNFKSKK